MVVSLCTLRSDRARFFGTPKAINILLLRSKARESSIFMPFQRFRVLTKKPIETESELFLSQTTELKPP